MPPSRLDEPETTSAVMGDFHEPYGAITLLFREEDIVLKLRGGFFSLVAVVKMILLVK